MKNKFLANNLIHTPLVVSFVVTFVFSFSLPVRIVERLEVPFAWQVRTALVA